MADINWGALTPLSQMGQTQIAQPQARPAPAPQIPSEGMGNGVGQGVSTGGLGGLLTGLKGLFGSNPVSVANQALTTQMQNTPGPDLAKAITGNTPIGQPGQATGQIPRSPMQGAMNNPNSQNTTSVANTGVPQPIPQANDSLGISTGLLKGFEGYQATPKWDVNAYRAGYGSDTTTDSNGKVSKIVPGMNISKDDAERDLNRRAQEFQTQAANQVGNDFWKKLSSNTQASLTSVAYNYGSLPKNIVQAAQTGDPQKISESIQAHANDNHGINNNRRMQEAQFALNGNPNQGREALNQHNDVTSIKEAHETPTPDIKSGIPVTPEMEKTPAFQESIKAYAGARQQGITKSPYVVSVDFSQPATAKRLSVINAETGKIVFQSEVAQGSGKGFGNTPGGHQSSLGTFQTTQEYNGAHGKSLRIKGLDKGVNDNVEARDVVVHGADYIGNGKTGHSFGCFAVPTSAAPKLINLIKDGAIIHASAGVQAMNQSLSPSVSQQNTPLSNS